MFASLRYACKTIASVRSLPLKRSTEVCLRQYRQPEVRLAEVGSLRVRLREAHSHEVRLG